jgi:hypothetical protein
LWFKNLFPQKSAYNNTGYPPVLKTNNGPLNFGGQSYSMLSIFYDLFHDEIIESLWLSFFQPHQEKDWMLLSSMFTEKFHRCIATPHFLV